MATPTASFPALIERLTRSTPGRPLITFYDDSTGERTELSVTTYVNWITKTANLLQEEYLLEGGDTVLLDLPTHWLTPVFMGAAWLAGVAVTSDPGAPAHLVVSGPSYDEHRDRDVPTLACSLHPFATRFAERLPDGVDDFGLLWPGQPDAFLGSEIADATAIACRHGSEAQTQADLLALAGAATWTGDRLLTDVHPTLDCGAHTWLAAMVRDGSVVLVHDADETGWAHRRDAERATAELRR